MGADTGYDRLTALDETFLHLERPETPMHVGAVAILERAPFYGADGRFRLDEVRALVASRLQLIPRFRKRVMPVPFGRGRPVWVDHDEFDIAEHVRLTALPAPGTRRQLFELAERLMTQVLDRDRPLWELWFVDGVDRGEHVGLIHKSHHTLTDGISGVDIATVLLDFDREPTVLDPDEWAPAPAPDPARLVVDTVRERVTRPSEMVSTVRRATDAPRDAVDRATGLGRSIGSLLEGQFVAPRLSLNGPVRKGRRIETVRVPLDTVRRVREAFGCTVNDVVLAVVGSAIGRVLDAHGELHPDLVLKVFCPVSVRDDGQRMQLGNRISTMVVPLPVGEPDARVRLDAVRATTVDLKERQQAVGAAALLGLSEYAAPTLLGLAARVAHAQRVANLIVTNVPGPQVPLYCLGALMHEVYPVVPLSRNLTLNVASLSYCGQLHFGLIGDGQSGRDLERLAGGIEDAVAELGSLAAREVTRVPRRARTDGRSSVGVVSRTEDPTAEVTDLLQLLIRNQCVNDGTLASGEETRSVDLLAGYLAGAGDHEIYEPQPGRQSLVARIEGTDPDAPVLLLMGHTDVVPVNPDGWSRDPFGAEVVDGFVWGRGAVDMLNLTASQAVAFRRLANSGFKPRGTLIYLAVADEEALGRWGADWLLQHERDAVYADYVLTEAGGFQIPTPAGPRLPVVVGEKGTFWTKIRVHGTPGHGSQPFRTDNALITAAEVVRRIAEYRPQTQIHESWHQFVEGLQYEPELTAALLSEDGLADALAELPVGVARHWHACTHTTFAPTVAHGGTKTNVIPDLVELEVDIRTLPGQSGADATALLRDALGDLADAVEIESNDDPATSSPIDTPLWDSLSRTSAALCQGSALVPSLMVGGTDNRFYRRAGAVGYGFGLFSQRLPYEDFAVMFHGNDEKVDQESLALSTQLWEAVARDLVG